MGMTIKPTREYWQFLTTKPPQEFWRFLIYFIITIWIAAICLAILDRFNAPIDDMFSMMTGLMGMWTLGAITGMDAVRIRRAHE